MRRLFYCGEWIQSHALHIHLLAAPDFLGFASAPAMAVQYGAEVRRGLALQGLGNASDGEFTSLALRHPDEYPMNEGRLCSSTGLAFDSAAFQDHVEEFQAPHSTALHARLEGRPYLCGPLARLNLNHDRLPAALRPALAQAGCRYPDANMFHSITARAVEILYSVHEALRLLDDYEVPAQAHVPARPRGGIGAAATEAPRGVLWHRYELDAGGRVAVATIVPPTSQNQARIEEDLRESLARDGFDRPDAELRLQAEKIIRNYDPCISCATHFLRLTVERA
jgi:sulfhydrogenase subunit alpha